MSDSIPQLDEETARSSVIDIVSGNDELLKNPEEYADNDHPLAGHCYVATEAFFHLTGGYGSWFVERLSVGDVTHWYLRDRDDPSVVVDLTESQFDVDVDHSSGVKTGFLTSDPSKRTQKVLEKVLD